MKTLFFTISLLTGSLFSQTVYTTAFNSFLDTTATDSTITLFLFDSTFQKMGIDYSANNHDLTWSVGATAWTDSIYVDNPLVNGGLHHKMPATGNWNRTSEASQNPGTSKFFIVMIVKVDNALTQYDWFGKLVWSGTAWNGYSLSLTTTPRIEFTVGDGTSHKIAQYNFNYVGQGWLAIAGIQNNDSLYVYVNGEKTNATLSSAYDITTSNSYVLGGRNYFGGRIVYFRQEKYGDLSEAIKKVREISGLPNGWRSNNGNVVREDLISNWYLTAYNDTLCVPLPDATLGANQEWVFDVKNRDTDGSGSTDWWIGKKRQPKTTVKTINCGSSFENDKVYFGDGFALSGDTLWVAFSDTVSVDNVVLSKVSHHLKTNYKFKSLPGLTR